MPVSQARELLVSAARTETGRDILTALGFAPILSAPERGDDASTVHIAQQLREEFRRRYGI